MAEPARDRPRVYASGDQLRGRVVAELVQGRLDTQARHHAVVPLRHTVRARERRAVGLAGEQERVARPFNPQRGSPTAAPLDVLAEHGDRLSIQRDPPLLVGLEVAFNPAGAGVAPNRVTEPE